MAILRLLGAQRFDWLERQWRLAVLDRIADALEAALDMRRVLALVGKVV